MTFQKDIKKLTEQKSFGEIFPLKKIGLLLFLILFCFYVPQAQVRKELEDKRRRLLQDIELTSNLLNRNTKTKAAALDRYVALRKQIEQRELLVETLRKEIQFTEFSIERAGNVVQALGDDIVRLEKEYGELLRQSYRRKKNNSNLAFVFSAESLNQGFRRWQYLRQYDEYRKKQAQLIVETKETLSDKKNQLERTKLEKETLIDAAENQSALLSAELGDKSKLLSTLKKDEKRLKRELRQQRTDHEGLNNAIEKAIRKDMLVRRKRERNREPNPNTKKESLNKKPSKENEATTLDRLANDFKKNRGRLPMPVKDGVVTKRFGKQAHPTLPRIEITNNGIDIRTERNAKVYSIFEGKVVSKQFIPGYQNMLIVQHGEYYTVYSNLAEVYVKKGEQIKTMQSLGTVAVDRKSKVSEVHFEVWRDKVRLNPEDWVK